MSRIFLTLALLTVLLLATNLLLAVWIGDWGRASQRYVSARDALRAIEESPDASFDEIAATKQRFDEATSQLYVQRERFWPHIWLGILAALVSLLVNCVAVTYFVGTSRWCREVVEAYGLDPALAERSQRLKRRTFPWALTGILTTLLIVVLGGASEPYSPWIPNPAAWVTWHLTTAMAGVVVIGVSFLVQVKAVDANYGVISEIMAQVQRVRGEHRTDAARLDSESRAAANETGGARY